MRLRFIEDMVPSSIPEWATQKAAPEVMLAKLAEYVENRYEMVPNLTTTDYAIIVTALRHLKGNGVLWVSKRLGINDTYSPEVVARAIVNGQADLQNLVDLTASANQGPATQPIEGSPPLNTLDDHVKQMLLACSPSALIDKYAIDVAQPFIYDATNDKLYVGHDGAYHSEILAAYNNTETGKINQAIYLEGEYDHRSGDFIPNSSKPGAVGRIARGLGDINPGLAEASIISIYARENSDVAIVKRVIGLLVDRKYSPPDAYVLYGSTLTTAAEIAGIREADKEAIEKGKLQIALHIGAWPNGKRLTPQEKELIRKKLGMTPVQKQHPVASALRTNKLAAPGHKWWAPTSEGRRFKLRDLS